MIWLVQLTISLLASQQDPQLRPGEPIAGTIEATDPVIVTKVLERDDLPGTPTRGKSFTIEVTESGDYYVDVMSRFFKPYLVLCDAEGTVLTEDDYGRWGVLPRLILTLEAGTRYTRRLGSRFADPGPFTLEMNRGAPPAAPSSSPEAIADARAGVDEARNLAGDESVAVGLMLHRLAFQLWKPDTFREAAEYFSQAVAIRETVLGDHENTAESLDSLAQVMMQMRDYEVARPILERAIAIRQKVCGPTHRSTATTCNSLGALSFRVGKKDEAARYFELALAGFDRMGPGAPETISVLYNVAMLHYELGNFAEARPHFQRLLGIFETAFGERDARTTKARSNLGTILYELGEYDEARPLLEQALARREEAHGPEAEETLTTLNNLAAVLHATGSYDEAIDRFRRVAATFESKAGADSEVTATALHNVARVLRDISSLRREQKKKDAAEAAFAEARLIFERALAIREKQIAGGDEAGTTDPLAFHHASQTLDNLGALLHEHGDTQAAQPLMERALELRTRVLGADHPWTAHCMHNLGVLLQASGDLDRARTLLEGALAIREKWLGSSHIDTTRTLQAMAMLLVDLGQLEQAWATARRATADSEEQIRQTLWGLDEIERLEYAQIQRRSLDALLYISRNLDTEARRAHAYETVLRWKGQVSRSLLAARPRALMDLDTEQHALVKRLRRVQSRLSDLLYAKEPENSTEQGVNLARLRKERRDIERRLSRTVKAPAEDPAPADLEAIRKSLPPNSAVVDFLVHRDYRPAVREANQPVRPGGWTDPVLTAWLQQAAGPGLVRLDLGPAESIRIATKQFLEELVSSRGVVMPDEEREPGAPSKRNDQLRARLWDPLEARLDKDIARIFVSPDGFLGTLPFEIVMASDRQYLVEKFAFVYLQDIVRLPSLMQSSPPESPSLLAIGGVDYRRRGDAPVAEDEDEDQEEDEEAPTDATRGSLRKRWTRLSWTSVEADAIEELHEEGVGEEVLRLVLKKKEATEERVKLELPRHNLIHVATHGFFQPEGVPSRWKNLRAGSEAVELRGEERRLTGQMPGLLSGLVFAGANADEEEGRDNGLLTAEEVSSLDLSRVDLLVLSACDTGYGVAAAGEGMIGLRRSFRQAGARTVISSLWSVQDEATSDLMTLFYEFLWLEGQGKHEALRNAQLELLAQNRGETDGDGMPSTWGAFVLDGAWK